MINKLFKCETEVTVASTCIIICIWSCGFLHVYIIGINAYVRIMYRTDLNSC